MGSEIEPHGKRRGAPGGLRLGAAHLRARDAYRDVPILKQPTWNHEVAAYFFFGGVSAGSALLGSIALLVDGEGYKDLARVAHYVSFATLLPCPFLLIDDLGIPRRFHHMLRIFKPSSPMNLGSWALTAHGMGAMVTILCMLARDGKLPIFGAALRLLPERLLALLGIPSAFTLAGYTGVLLGTTSVPVWFSSPLLGALFMASAMGTGVAAVEVVTTLSGKGARDGKALSLIELTCEGAVVMLLGSFLATSGAAARPLREGWTGKLVITSVASTVTALLGSAIAAFNSGRRSKVTRVGASTAALVGGAILRWAVVGAGKASVADREGTLEAMGRSSRSPGWGVGYS